MNKLDFLLRLKEALEGLPKDELEERLNFYSEIIDDRIEEGLSEDEAVAATGSVEEIAAQVVAETPLVKIVKEKIKPKKKRKALEIVLISVGSPVWVPILISLLAVFFLIYVCLWAVVICLYASSFTCFGTALGGLTMAVVQMRSGQIPEGVALIGVSLALVGIGILIFVGSNLAAKGVVALTKKMLLGTKKLLMKREEEK